MKLWDFMPGDRPQIPIVANIPHSGTYIPKVIRRQFRRNPPPVLTNQDWHLERLYDFLPQIGISVLRATRSRYVVDLNREVKSPLFGPAASSVVAQTNTQGSLLYDEELSIQELETRISRYYRPYHEKLEGLLTRIARGFGHAILLDLHSYFLPTRHDICLGNQHGGTCSEGLMVSFEQAFRCHGFNVGRNDVLAGGFITRYYGARPNVESLQIEVRFPVYLEREDFGEVEIDSWDSPKFRNAQERLHSVFSMAIKILEKGPKA